MQVPVLDDTIVAVSTGWLASALGIVRLSGPEAFALCARLGVRPPARFPQWTPAEMHLAGYGAVPARGVWFRAPRSYTGQDLVELHTVGCRPLLRELGAALVGFGGRRALPGEFTARAFVAGRLTPDQVAGVLDLLRAGREAELRDAARRVHGATPGWLAAWQDRLTDLLARIEANIDFTDEEDVQVIAADEVATTLHALLHTLRTQRNAGPAVPTAAHPHVALAGLPNAGKSTLFNTLLGRRRAIVSPLIATTRDVLSAEVDLSGARLVLQDCAGLGNVTDELDLASRRAAEGAADRADVVIWVHACDAGWEPAEVEALQRIESGRRLLALNKIDRSTPTVDLPKELSFAAINQVSALTGAGVADLTESIASVVGRVRAGGGDDTGAIDWEGVEQALERAQGLIDESQEEVYFPELISLELRTASAAISAELRNRLDEHILERIYAEFCVGK